MVIGGTLTVDKGLIGALALSTLYVGADSADGGTFAYTDGANINGGTFIFTDGDSVDGGYCRSYIGLYSGSLAVAGGLIGSLEVV